MRRILARRKMENPAEFESAACWFVANRSVQLSYGFKMVGIEGFEPPAPPSQAECADQTALYPDGGRSRYRTGVSGFSGPHIDHQC